MRDEPAEHYIDEQAESAYNAWVADQNEAVDQDIAISNEWDDFERYCNVEGMLAACGEDARRIFHCLSRINDTLTHRGLADGYVYKMALAVAKKPWTAAAVATKVDDNLTVTSKLNGPQLLRAIREKVRDALREVSEEAEYSLRWEEERAA